MLRNFVMVLALVASLAITSARSAPNETHHISMTGSELYAACQAWQKNVTITEGGDMSVTEDEGAFLAGKCFGYVIGIAESLPIDEYFNPDVGVHNSQYVDVVIAYLRDHPELRHHYAIELTQNALIKAFPGRKSSK